MSIIQSKELSGFREKHGDKKIVFCSGCFDLTHAGHVLFFEDCKKLGDVLVVAVGNDANIKQYKGGNRPILNEHLRLKIIDSLKPVDYCFLDHLFAGDDPLSNLEVVFRNLKPDIYVVNDDAFDLSRREEMTRVLGVKMEVLKRKSPPEFKGVSTSNIIEKIRKLEN